MAKDLKYYKDLSNQLGKEIEILESSYQDFEKVIAINNFNIRELSDEQRRVLGEFGTFSKEEGFSKDGRIRVETYNDVKSSIVERVEFLKKQKEINDKMLSLQNDLNKLKKENTLNDADVEGLKKSVAKRYDEGTEKYVEELEKAKKKLVAKRIEETKESITKANEEVKKNKKENGLGKVVSSAFGPLGNKIYNAYVGIHNANVDLRKKRGLNLAVKLGLSYAFLGLVYVSGLSGFPMVVGIGIGVVGAIRSVVNTFKEIPGKLETKNNFTSLKEAWKRFRKSRGKGELSIEKKLYNGIDFSKYEKKKSDEVEEFEKNEDKKDEKPKLAEEEIKTETPELPEDDKKDEVPELPKEDKEEKGKEGETLELAKDIKKENNSKLPKNKDYIPEKNSGLEINSISDIMPILYKLKSQDGLKTVDDWYTCKNICGYLSKEYLKTGNPKYNDLMNMIDEMRKHMPKELRERLQMIKTFEKVDVSNKRKGIASQVKDATATYREQEYSKIIVSIANNDNYQEVAEEVDDFLTHYGSGITKQQMENIKRLMSEKEEKINKTSGRGK